MHQAVNGSGAVFVTVGGFQHEISLILMVCWQVVNGSGAVFFTVGGFEYGSEVIRVVLSLRNGGVQVLPPRLSALALCRSVLKHALVLGAQASNS